MCANCRRELDSALAHAQKAVSLSPKATDYLDTLAEIHFRRNEIDKATAVMKQCAELAPNRAYFRKQLERFAKGDTNSAVPDGEE